MIEIIRLEAPLEMGKEKKQWFRVFAQSLVNRLIVGELRYGPGSKKQKYLTRLIKTIEVYKSTGNAEYLFDIANYAFLEFIFPEHPKHHFNPEAQSATRQEKDV